MRPFAAAIRVLAAEGPAEVLRRALRVLARWPERRKYRRWAALHDRLSAPQREALRLRASALAWRPRVSILMPVYNTQAEWLRKALDSVLAQIYPAWELCIADDASTQPHVRQLLQEYSARDSRIKLVFRKANGHIAAATNSALAIATGEFIALMDHDDLVPAQALLELVGKLNEGPSLDMVYSDEDKVDSSGGRFDPGIKPDWSPEYLESCMYTAHLALYRKTIADQIGGFRSGYDGAQDYDFALRFTERTDRIAHVPEILYHWRSSPGSTAASMHDKEYVVPAGIMGLQDRLERTGRRGTVRSSRYAACFDVRTALTGQPLVSIVIPTAGGVRRVRREPVVLVSHCVARIRDLTTYPNFEIVIVDNGKLATPVREALAAGNCRLATDRGEPFNLSRMRNLGASKAQGGYLLFLDDDVEVVSGDWIEALLEQGGKPGVGVVGAKLLYEDGSLQHVGIAHRDGLPGNLRQRYPRSDPGFLFSTLSVRNYLAVSGACLLTPADLFRRIGGFDERYRAHYGDSDYALALRGLGQRAVYTPHAELVHFESRSRPAEALPGDAALYLEKWGAVTKNDPYYNASRFRTTPLDFGLRLEG